MIGIRAGLKSALRPGLATPLSADELSTGVGGVDTLLSIAVTPSNPTWRPTASSDRQQFTAIGTYSISGAVDITATVTWSSGTVATATINATGEATAVSANNGTSGAARTSTITATLGAVSGNTVLSVDTDRDATSGIRVPVNAYQWTTLLGITPTSLHRCQEASGNLADSIGAQTLTAANTPLYNQAVAGWTRTGVATTNATGQRFSGTTYGNSATDSLLTIAFVAYNSATVGAGSHIMVYGGNNDASVTSGDTANELKARYREGVNIAEGATTLTVNTVYPITLKRNITGSEARLYTDTEKLSPAFDVSAGTVFSIGSAAGTVSGPFTYVYVVEWLGATAEMTDAQVKAILVALGWTITWT